MDNVKIVTGHTGVAHVTREDAQNIHRSIYGYNQCFILSGIGNECSFTHETDANTVTIHSGDLMIDGVHARITGDVALAISAGVSGQYRHDLICARFACDQNTQVDSVELVVIKGTPSATGLDPNYNNDPISAVNLIRDFPLYRVVRYGSTIQSITKLAKTFYPVDSANSGLSATYVKSAGEGFTKVGGYDSTDGGNAAYIYAMDESKNKTAAFVIYENGLMTYQKDSTAFPLPFIRHGTKSITLKQGAPGAAYAGSATVTFNNPYDGIPTVVCSVNEGGSSLDPAYVTITNISKTGFTINVAANSSVNPIVKVNWIAAFNKIA